MESNETEYLYGLLMEGRMDAMYLPSGAVAWLWKDERPIAQVDAAVLVGSLGKASGNEVIDASLLRSDHNVLTLHMQSGVNINVYPDGGYGSNGQVIDRIHLEGFIGGRDESELPDVLGNDVTADVVSSGQMGYEV